MDGFFSAHLQIFQDKLSISHLFCCYFRRCVFLKQPKEQRFVFIQVKVSITVVE